MSRHVTRIAVLALLLAPILALAEAPTPPAEPIETLVLLRSVQWPPFNLPRVFPAPPPEDFHLERPGPRVGTLVPTCPAAPGTVADDLCRAGEQLGRMRACTDPRDCDALEAWRTLYGAPRPRPAPAREEPQTTADDEPGSDDPGR